MEISIDQLAGGGLMERINRELQRVADNVLDPNTKPDAVRKLTIELKIKPSEDRQMGAAEFNVKSTLVPAKGLPSAFIFDYGKDGKAVMQELNMSKQKDQTALADNGDIVDGVGNKVVNGKFR